jgi:AAA+ superfamily predicted ATPase
VEILDSALARRFDEVVEYTLPDTAVARAIIERRLGKLKLGSKSWSELEPSNKRTVPSDGTRSTAKCRRQATP